MSRSVGSERWHEVRPYEIRDWVRAAWEKFTVRSTPGSTEEWAIKVRTFRRFIPFSSLRISGGEDFPSYVCPTDLSAGLAAGSRNVQ
jgi:hypothetical protein